MRRICLAALALLGAIAATGCGGAGGTTPASSDGNKGIENASFKLVVRGENAYWDASSSTTIILPKGGVITSTPADLINCGVNGAGTLNKVCEATLAYGTAVTLTATPNGDADHNMWGWAGACIGTGACAVSMVDTKFVGVRFATRATIGAHGPFTAPAIHANEYLKFVSSTAGAYVCTSCHGGTALLGSGLAPSCASCHGWPLGGHFNGDALAGHNSGTCARCHNGYAFRELVGADGQESTVTTIGYLSSDPTPLDSSSVFQAPGYMQCNTCHNSATVLGGGALSQHKFASGNVVTLTDAKSAICAQCHDGGRPGYNIAQLNAVLTNTGNNALAQDAQLVQSNATVRAHYLPAASTLYGATAATWAQYAGNIYTAENKHGGVNGCTFCHNAHTGELPADSNFVEPESTIRAKCGPCHYNEAGAAVANFLEFEESRQFGFEGDVDADGTVESVKLEIDGLAAKLLTAIQTYATTVSGTGICYFDNRFYIEAAAGACGTTPNNVAYNKFTKRLLKAAFNYLMYTTDPGAWAHNPRYAIEVIYDSIADLNVGLGAAFVPNGDRAFNGHFGAAENPSPYSTMIYHGGSNALTGEVLPGASGMGFTSAACYQCHGGKVGYEAYLTAMPAALAAIPAGGKVNAMQCDLCHVFGETMKGLRTAPATVYFPPQKAGAADSGQVTFTAAQLPASFPLCGTCHSGRENGASLTKRIGATADSTWSLSSMNPHYRGAAGMMLGSNAAVMYQFAGNSYTGYPAFWSLGANGPHGSPHGAKCTGCHDPKGSTHSFEIHLGTTVPSGNYCAGGNLALCAPNTKTCDGCHAGPYALGPKEEEFHVATAELYAAIRAYVVDPVNLGSLQAAVNGATFGGGTTGQPAITLDGSTVTGICYDGDAGPFFFLEVVGTCMSVGDATHSAMSMGKFNPTLLKAAFNYRWVKEEPGAWAHNEFYVLQVIYDSIVALGSTPSFTVTASATDATLNRP